MLPDIDDIFVSDAADAGSVNEDLYAAGLTDGLPVVPPTRARVRSMIGERPPDTALGVLAPLGRAVTVKALASCAVMAGCAPEHFPALISAVNALQDPAFNLLGVLTTTGSAAVGCILHGPYAAAIGANAGSNCLGPGNRANAVIGRGLALALRNLGGAVPGILDMATMGQPAKYSFCFAENEAATPWPTLAAERGFGPEESAVTVFATAGTVEIVDTKSREVEDLLLTLANSMPIPGNLGSGEEVLGGGEALVLLPPEWATRLTASGWSKQRAREYIFDKASLPLDRISPDVRAAVAENPARDGFLRVARTPSDVILVVTGGVGGKATFVPTWSGGTRSVTARVEPD